jgi:hypothetical protein
MKQKLKNIFNWKVIFGLCLIGLSTIIFIGHYLAFHDLHHIFIYLVHDIAFIPIEVLIVTLIIHKVISSREHKAKLNKLNMVIGTFFSEVGTDLISFIAAYDPYRDDLQKRVLLDNKWTDKQFTKTVFFLRLHKYEIEVKHKDLQELKTLLLEKRAFLLDLLGNPNLLEHDAFTDLLWAVFHLTEELQHRKKITKTNQEDLEHLGGDIKRVYSLLVKEWLAYMKHLKYDYPYLFSLAVRTNPFDPNSSAEIS